MRDVNLTAVFRANQWCRGSREGLVDGRARCERNQEWAETGYLMVAEGHSLRVVAMRLGQGIISMSHTVK